MQPLCELWAGAIFKADEAVNPRGCVEYSRQLYGGDGRPTQMLFGLASGAAFGALPGRARFCVGPVGQDRQPGGVAAAGLEFLERDISYAFIGERLALAQIFYIFCFSFYFFQAMANVKFFKMSSCEE